MNNKQDRLPIYKNYFSNNQDDCFTSMISLSTGPIVVMNFLRFIEKQLKINNRFPNPNRLLKFSKEKISDISEQLNNLAIPSDKIVTIIEYYGKRNKYINIFDSMAGQINEECFEFCEALDKYNALSDSTEIYNQSLNVIEEFFDTMMYIGSLYIESAIAFNIDPIEFIKDNGIEFLEFNIDMEPSIDRLNSNANAITAKSLGFLRRRIYDRKYHKPAKDKPNNYERDFLFLIITTLYQPDDMVGNEGNPMIENPPALRDISDVSIKDMISYMYTNIAADTDDKWTIYNLNKILKNKQDFIGNL